MTHSSPENATLADLIDRCERYAKIIEGIIVVPNDWQPGGPERREPRETLLEAAQALRSRIRAQCAPDGWQLVPKEPTKEMIQACIWALDRWREKHGNVQGFVPPGDKYQVRWRAMLKAAPSAPCFKAAQNTAESDPLVTPDCHGAETGSAFASPDVPAQQMTDHTAWLVEINERFGPVYFQFVHDDDWTKDHDKAAHFSRKEDAERVIEHYGWTSAKAVEHTWPAFASPKCGDRA